MPLPPAEYDAWGNDLSGNFTTNTQNIRQFRTGKFFDEIAGLYYNQARWYDPTLGRFISESPIAPMYEEDYVYCHNAPISFVDYNGEQCEEVLRYLPYIPVAGNLLGSAGGGTLCAVATAAAPYLAGLAVVGGIGYVGYRTYEWWNTPDLAEETTWDEVWDDALPGDPTKGPTTQKEKPEGDKDEAERNANRDFDRLPLSNEKPIERGGRTGKLPDGTDVNVHPKSRDGRPTLERQIPSKQPRGKTKYQKIRYGTKK